jgi:hypothetical protein
MRAQRNLEFGILLLEGGEYRATIGAPSTSRNPLASSPLLPPSIASEWWSVLTQYPFRPLSTS